MPTDTQNALAIGLGIGAGIMAVHAGRCSIGGLLDQIWRSSETNNSLAVYEDECKCSARSKTKVASMIADTAREQLVMLSGLPDNPPNIIANALCEALHQRPLVVVLTETVAAGTPQRFSWLLSSACAPFLTPPEPSADAPVRRATGTGLALFPTTAGANAALGLQGDLQILGVTVNVTPPPPIIEVYSTKGDVPAVFGATA